jgi:hypothetical protein
MDPFTGQVLSAGTVHIRVGTGGLDHLSEWESPTPPEWTDKRDLSYGYGRLSFFDSGDLLFEFVRTGFAHRAQLLDADPTALLGG